MNCDVQDFNGLPSFLTVSSDLAVIVQVVNELQQGQRRLEGVCRGIVEQEKKMMTAVNELKGLIEEQTKKNYTLKSTPYEVS